MKSNIVADGKRRLCQSRTHQERLLQLRTSIHAKYAPDLATAGLFRRWLLHLRMAAEFRRERARTEPSSQALYLGSASASPKSD